MFRKDDDDMYVSSRDGTKRVDLQNYNDINEEVSDNLEKTEAKIAYLIE